MSELTRKNSFNAFEAVIDLMNQKSFRRLVDEYFENYSDIKSIILIVKTYQHLETMYVKRNQELPSKDYMANGIRELFRNTNTLRFLRTSTETFMEDYDTFENIVEENLGNRLLLQSAATLESIENGLNNITSAEI